MDPTSILFSPPRNVPKIVLKGLSKPWFELGIEPRAIGRLGPDEEGGMRYAGKVNDCDGWETLLCRAEAEPMQAVHFYSRVAQDDLYVYQWTERGERRLSAELGNGRLRYFESDDYPVGRYQVALMLALTVAADVDVAAYGKDYDEELFVALDSVALLDKLRQGTLMTKWTPAVYMISTRLMGKAEVEAAIARNAAWHLKFFITTSGYHVLSQYAGGE